jgi:hypothetical protein
MLLNSCCSSSTTQKEVSEKYWQLKIPQKWTVEKARNGYQITSEDFPGIFQVSSQQLKDEDGVLQLLKTLPDQCSKQFNAQIITKEAYHRDNDKGIYFEYLDDQHLTLFWIITKNNIVVAASYISQNPIPSKDKIKIKNLVQHIKFFY